MRQFTPTLFGFGVASDDDYCGIPYPHWPLQFGTVNPGVFAQPGVQQGIIIIGG